MSQPNVYLLDSLPNAEKLDAQDRAMLQALYSRSDASVTQHLDKVDQSGSSRFMSQFYTGYGHDSIGDCGNVTLFFEGVSILAAKAIQDTPLYNGQETSTRYIDFTKRPFRTHTGFVDPESDWTKILEGWRALYTKVYDHAATRLGDAFPAPEGATPKEQAAHERAIRARAFDVARGFLPAGATTQVAWTGTIRHVRDRLKQLFFHPLPELHDLAKLAWVALSERYPESFPDPSEPASDSQKAANEYASRKAAFTYVAADPADFPRFDTDFIMDRETAAEELGDLLTERPRLSLLPSFVSIYGNMYVTAQLDYASFRDIQRHRAGVCRMPLLTGDFGMHPWYFDQLDPAFAKDLQGDIGQVFADLMSAVAEAQLNGGITHELIQYYLPMASIVPVILQYDLREAIYVAELRSSATVHPTLRELALKIGAKLQEEFPTLQLHLDDSPDTLSLKRGAQTILNADGSELTAAPAANDAEAP